MVQTQTQSPRKIARSHRLPTASRSIRKRNRGTQSAIGRYHPLVRVGFGIRTATHRHAAAMEKSGVCRIRGNEQRRHRGQPSKEKVFPRKIRKIHQRGTQGTQRRGHRPTLRGGPALRVLRRRTTIRDPARTVEALGRAVPQKPAGEDDGKDGRTRMVPRGGRVDVGQQSRRRHGSFRECETGCAPRHQCRRAGERSPVVRVGVDRSRRRNPRSVYTVRDQLHHVLRSGRWGVEI
mmetsp:Transcript_16369/g.24865  ORF Transcript_16369/g.24865 Transcript_16369/m.24865 type:complete len:235 (+) Transcript_16369:277-981(+)